MNPPTRFSFQRNGQTESARRLQCVVMATPGLQSRASLGSFPPRLAQTLSGIPYAGVAVVAAGYGSQQIGPALDGFGFLVPRSEKRRTLGTVWNSSLFPGRAPAGGCTMTSFVGGATEPDVLQKPEEEIAALVQDENSKILGITGPPVASAVWKHPKALPQYNLGHGHIVEAIRDGGERKSGDFFFGQLPGRAFSRQVRGARIQDGGGGGGIRQARAEKLKRDPSSLRSVGMTTKG